MRTPINTMNRLFFGLLLSLLLQGCDTPGGWGLRNRSGGDLCGEFITDNADFTDYQKFSFEVKEGELMKLPHAVRSFGKYTLNIELKGKLFSYEIKDVPSGYWTAGYLSNGYYYVGVNQHGLLYLLNPRIADFSVNQSKQPNGWPIKPLVN